MQNQSLKSKAQRLTPWIVLTICAALSVTAFWVDRSFQKRTRTFALEREIEILQSRILERFQAYEDALRGGRGLFYASEAVSRQEWKKFVAALNVSQRYPGIRGLGYIHKVDDVKAFETDARRQFDQNFRIWPQTDLKQKQVIRYLEPEERNVKALGFDMASESIRREKIFAARDTGETQITPRLNLVQDQNRTPAFLVFVPIYDQNLPTNTLEQRRLAYRGAVYGFFEAESFIKGALSNLQNSFDLRIFDGAAASQKNLSLLYQSDERPFSPKAEFARESLLPIYGQSWKVQWTLKGDLITPIWEDEAVLAVGLLFSLMVFWLMRNMMNTRDKSMALAEEMTAEVRNYSAMQAAILNSTRYIIITSDRNNIIQHMNSAAEAALGIKAEDAIGKVSAISFIAPEDLVARKDQIARNWAKLSEDRDPRSSEAPVAYESEWTYVSRDGRRFPARLQLTSIRDDEGRVTGYVGISRDISDEKEVQRGKELTEAKLKQSEAKFRMFMDHSPALVSIKDAEGRVAYVNRRVAERFGLKADEWMGKSLDQIYPPDIAAAKRAIDQKVLSEGKAVSEYLTVQDAEGEDCHLFVMRFPLVVDGSGGEIGAISIDVTEQKRAEKRLSEALKEAQEANVSKSEFLANMSHEIRTPMNGIIGMTELLLQTHLVPEQREFLNIVRKSADSLLGIINDILDFSKIDSGKMQLESLEFDLQETLNAAVKPLAIMAEEKGLRLTSVLDPEAQTVVQGDPLRLTQVLINLLGNAIKFTISGDITLTVKRLPAANCRLQFSVKDNGIGIPADKLGRIFEAFTQADGSMTRNYGGSGLGLTISSRLVALMGGEIQVKSQVDVGSEFSFTIELPEKRGVAKVAALPELKRERDFQGLRVLLTEDNVINQTLAVRILERRKCKVTLASNGMEAVDAFLRTGFDIILMDIQMPVMTGTEATQRIRKLEADGKMRATPIVAMTAHAMQGDRERFLGSGMDDYISKPIRMDELFAIIERLTEGHMTNAKNTGLVNERKILEDLADDWDLILEVGNLFLQTAEETLADLKSAVDAKDAKNIEHHAHKYKGAVAIFGADEVVELAQTIEDLGENGNIAMVPEIFAKLLSRSADLRHELKIFLQQRSAA